MSTIAIRAENLGKQYRIGGKQASYHTIREALLNAVSSPLRRLQGIGQPDNTFWALDGISFDIQDGEAVGIIGRNGAGKSTLLKIISRITKPSRGRVELYGRVGSLLEVGTGFHPELTGRENIFLNGAVLGMTRAEIMRKFDEIVYFAEVEKFLDTPVKFYSSGMYVRLAFAVAAHLEPEILVVDEVLAVGDAEFQKKSLGKMGDVARGGRTVLFVSHNLGAIANLCTRALLIQGGKLLADGNVSDVITTYQTMSSSDVASVNFLPIESEAYFTKVSILDSTGKTSVDISVTEQFYIEFKYVVTTRLKNVDVAFILYDKTGAKIFISSLSDINHEYFKLHQPGLFTAKITIPAEFLSPGLYTITPAIHEFGRKLYDQKNQIIQFQIMETGSFRYRMMGVDTGAILVKFNWDVQAIASV